MRQLADNFIGCLLIVMCLGCGRGDGPKRVPVSGEVQYAGEPVRDGRIRFVPIAPDVGPVSISFVKDGRFTTAEFGGVPVGKHRVEILAYDTTDLATRDSGFGHAPPRQFLPARYNTQTELVVTVKSQPTELIHDFHLN